MNDNRTNASSHPLLSLTDGLAHRLSDTVLLAGRILVGLIFTMGGWRKLTDIGPFVKSMPRRGLPEMMGYIAPPVEFVGGLFMLFGFATRYTALVLLLFTVIATFSSHAYWTYPVAEQANQQSHFMKNVSIMGAFMLAFITGAGRISLDWLLRRKA